MGQLPEWAAAALDRMAPSLALGADAPDPDAGAAYQEIRRRLCAHWRELELDFVPDVAELPDTGKRVILEQAIYAAKYWGGGQGRRLREAARELSALNQKIIASARELSHLLRQRSTLHEEFDLHDEMAGLVDVLDQASRPFPHWRNACAIDELLRAVRSTSQAAPSVVDLVAAFAEASIEQTSSRWLDDVLTTQKSSADGLRALLDSLRELHHPAIPTGFRLSDRAVAALATHVLGVEATADRIKTLRHRSRK
jgi:hypothetical protein